MRVTEKGQITIPKELRDALGIGGGTVVDVERRGDTIVVRCIAHSMHGIAQMSSKEFTFLQVASSCFKFRKMKR